MVGNQVAKMNDREVLAEIRNIFRDYERLNPEVKLTGDEIATHPSGGCFLCGITGADPIRVHSCDSAGEISIFSLKTVQEIHISNLLRDYANHYYRQGNKWIKTVA